MNTQPEAEEYLKQEECGNKNSTYDINERSSYPRLNNIISPSFTKLQVAGKPTTAVKLENVNKTGAIKSETDDFDVKLEPLIQEEMHIKEEILTNELRIHTGERPFICNVCNYKCAAKWNLRNHLRTHTGEKPFICKVCDYKCSGKGSLRKHMRSHIGEKPFACNVCDYKCSQKGSLRKHMRSHTGEKPFICNVCDYKCTEKWILRNHMRTHTGEKPFACHFCNYKCSRKDYLPIHLRNHTKKNL